MYQVDRKRLLYLAVAAFLVFLVRVVRPDARTPMPSPVPQPIWHRLQTYRPAVLGFYENAQTSGQGQGSFPTLSQQASQIQIVAPLWYQIGGDGAVAAAHPVSQVANFAGSHHILMLPMFVNQGDGMLKTSLARSRTVDSILAQVRSGGYSGVFIDFELLPPVDRGPFTLLMQALAARLHPEGKKLGVAVFPEVGVPNSLNGAYDYGALSAACDYVVVMAYDAHYDGSPPGPVAPIGWVKKNIVEALRYLPPSHLYLGIGAYGYDWPQGSNGSTVSTQQARALLASTGATASYDPGSGEPHFTYWKNGLKHQVWYENRRTFGQKFALVQRYHLGGFGLWRLHFEDPGIWTDLRRLRH